MMQVRPLSPYLLLAVMVAYIGVLFAVGYWAERRARRDREVTNRTWIYVLSLTVYCTSLTYFGNVGHAFDHGMLFSAFNLGPTIVMLASWGIVRRMIRLRKHYQFSTVVDLITQRYGHSARMGALITMVMLVAMMPYIGAQILSVLKAFSILAGAPHNAQILRTGHVIDETLVVSIGVMTCVFGLRRVDTRVRQHGLLAVLAVESVVKLTAFVAVGIFVVWGVFDGPAHLLGRFGDDLALQEQFASTTTGSAYVTWMTYLVLSMAAFLFLPHMFHVMVVENEDERRLATAMWALPLYLMLFSLFALPIAAGGLLLGYPRSSADWLPIRMPLDLGMTELTLLAYVGGFSAAIGMIMVACTTMAIMFSNHIVLPLVENRLIWDGVRKRLRLVRWLVVFAMLFVAYWFEQELDNSYLLTQIGLITFVAMLQFAPVVLGGLYWPRGSNAGAWCGLLLGCAVWSYTLLAPAIAIGWTDTPEWLVLGPAGIGFLRPSALFGLDLDSPYFSAAFWSLLFNVLGYVGGSVLWPPTSEARQGEAYRDVFEEPKAVASRAKGIVEIDFATVRKQIDTLFSRYLPRNEADLALAAVLGERAGQAGGAISPLAYLDLSHRVEQTLAGAIGAAMARKAIGEALQLAPDEMEALKSVWADQLSELNIPPQKLREQIDYFRSLQEIADAHARAMEAKIAALEAASEARDHADAARRESERRFRSLADDAPVMIWMIDSADGEDFVNRAVCKFTGLGSLEDIKRGWREAIHPDDLQRASNLFKAAREREAVIEEVFRYLGPDGEYRHLRVQAARHRSDDGVCLGMVGTAIDISDLVAAEALLRRSNEEMEALIKGRTRDLQQTADALQREKIWSENIIRLAPNLIVGIAPNGTIVLFNDYAEQVTGYQRSEVIGKSLVDLFVPPEFHADIASLLCDIADSPNEVRHNETPILMRDGSQRRMSWSCQAILEGDEFQMILTFAVDVTERYRVQQELEENYAKLKHMNERLEEAQGQLLQSEKMASIGQLAAGIAHEINNPVGFVGSNLGTLKTYAAQMLELIEAYQAAETQLTDEALLRKIADLKQALDLEFLQEDLPALLEESEDGLHRVKKIVQDLKDFSHVNETEWGCADLNAGLDSTLNVVWNEVKYKAKVDKHYGEIPQVECLAAQLNQVFMNLIVNAVQAIDASKGMGTITLSTGCEGDWVWVEVADTGRGMTEEVQKRVFDPFFTTKPVGKGTGLGMSVSYNIVQKHGGRIELHSTVGVGTRFRVWIPTKKAN